MSNKIDKKTTPEQQFINSLIEKFDAHRRVKKLLSGAKQRKIPVNITLTEYVLAMNHGCFYCGKSLLSERGYCLDRINNKKSYTFENIAPCCKICNIAKNVLGYEEFREWIIRTYTWLKHNTLNAEKLKKEKKLTDPQEHLKHLNKHTTIVRIKYHPGSV